MSKKNLANMSFEERRNLAAQVKRLRLDAGMTQAELADLTGITRQALSNIERGAVPQAGNLSRIYEVFGVALEPVEFSPETSQWLAIVGGIMDSLPEPRRAAAGKAAVDAVTDELVAAANANRAVVSLQDHRDSKSVSGSDENVIPENLEEEWAGRYAADTKGDDPIDHS